MQKKKQVHLGPQFSINQSINSCLNHHFSHRYHKLSPYQLWLVNSHFKSHTSFFRCCWFYQVISHTPMISPFGTVPSLPPLQILNIRFHPLKNLLLQRPRPVWPMLAPRWVGNLMGLNVVHGMYPDFLGEFLGTKIPFQEYETTWNILGL